MNLPRARTAKVIIQELNDEVLVYDLGNNKSYCLNSTAGLVFNSCDGETTFEQLKYKYNLPDEIIHMALDGLKENNLLEHEYVSPFAGMSRREVIRKVGIASMATLPLIMSLVAPTAISASSVCNCGAAVNSNARFEGCPCSDSRECCGVCLLNGGNPICSAPTSGAQPTAAACCPPLLQP